MSISSRMPSRFINPMTSKLMVDPVVLENGRTVDRRTALNMREPIVVENIVAQKR